jgi:hypothetical protein
MIYNNRAGDGVTITSPAFNVSRETMTMKDYETDIAPAEHILGVVRWLYDPKRPDAYSIGDFECTFGDGNRTVRVDLMSGSTFEDDFDYSSLVGRRVKVGHAHGYLFIADEPKLLP